jgi:hypothetical protein
MQLGEVYLSIKKKEEKNPVKFGTVSARLTYMVNISKFEYLPLDKPRAAYTSNMLV